jgi:hypothetical protein
MIRRLESAGNVFFEYRAFVLLHIREGEDFLMMKLSIRCRVKGDSLRY